jgi:phenol 2-monooxygenase (NADPH)
VVTANCFSNQIVASNIFPYVATMNGHTKTHRHSSRNAPNRFLAQPLPLLSAKADHAQSHSVVEGNTYDAVIVGAGPAGSFLNLVLARYGVESVLCIDANDCATQVGHADGIVPRTVEILSAFGLESDLLRYGHHAKERADWKRLPAGDEKAGQLIRESRTPASYPGMNGRFNDGYFYGMHQGHIERIFEDDLALYTDRTVQRKTKLLSVKVDETDVDHPVQATLRTSDGSKVQVRSKYLVGADGAHSAVRNSLGISMDGETSDHVFGVIDLVPQTEYPDIHAAGNITTEEGTLLHVVREFRRDGYPLIRIYVPLDGIDAGATSNDDSSTPGAQNSGTATSDQATTTNWSKHRHDYSDVTPATILARANAFFAPYTIQPHESSPTIDWSTTYRVGQRVAAHQHWPATASVGSQHPHIFLIGDASHTHSPKVGQGLNVSIHDAHNLAWKLSYVLNGLVPSEQVPDLLASYQAERRPVAQDLIALDKLWFSTRYARLREKDIDPRVVFSEILGFVSGLAIEYMGCEFKAEGASEGSMLIAGKQDVVQGAEELAAIKAGRLRAGRRLPDHQCVRFADGGRIWLHELCDGRGCWWIVAFTGQDLGVVDKIAEAQARFVKGTVQTVVLHSRKHLTFEWSDLPKVVRKEYEMRFLGFEEPEKAYGMFGVGMKTGELVLVRPDGFVALLEDCTAEGVQRMEEFLGKVIVRT